MRLETYRVCGYCGSLIMTDHPERRGLLFFCNFVCLHGFETNEPEKAGIKYPNVEEALR